MLRVLFVQGFLTNTQPTYALLQKESFLSRCHVDFFSYDAKETLDQIEARLLARFQKATVPYDMLMGHSMGCFFLTRLADKVLATHGKQKLVFLMPFLSVHGMARLSTWIPGFLERGICLPADIIAPEENMTKCPDPSRNHDLDKNWIPLALEIQVAKQMNFQHMCRVLEQHTTRIVLGGADRMAPFTHTEQVQLEKCTSGHLFIMHDARHTPFNDCESTRRHFYDCLERLCGLPEARLKLRPRTEVFIPQFFWQNTLSWCGWLF